MVINVIGDCDKRPVLYTMMKICQTLGDVLFVTDNTSMLRLSDTRENYGHYQNTMIAITQEGIDDFFENFAYALEDFEYMIVDNIPIAEADLVVYVEGMVQSQNELDILEYVEEYKTIPLYKGSLVSGSTLRNLEIFEAFRDMHPIGDKVGEAVAKLLSDALGKDPKMIKEIAMQENPLPDTSGNAMSKKQSIIGKVKVNFKK
ncbi:MAG: hypothetical protein NC548_11395 [Lachnospiraceae bacterium]|nr:hypothetical protein [Lachnospiraceae bacterium]